MALASIYIYLILQICFYIGLAESLLTDTEYLSNKMRSPPAVKTTSTLYKTSRPLWLYLVILRSRVEQNQ